MSDSFQIRSNHERPLHRTKGELFVGNQSISLLIFRQITRRAKLR
jgi:hypothetical protein